MGTAHSCGSKAEAHSCGKGGCNELGRFRGTAGIKEGGHK